MNLIQIVKAKFNCTIDKAAANKSIAKSGADGRSIIS
jgi:hypothetical protein